MKVHLAGCGWVTPAGRNIPEAVQGWQNGAALATTGLPEAADWPVALVPDDFLSDVTRLPRLRRSSTISHLAVAAAKDAVAAANLPEGALSRCALIFAASDGGVIYTRRFYGDIVEHGPPSGSPALFPETVYNAPASHVAAVLGLSSELLTLVGDSSTGLAALHVGRELLLTGQADHCLVVGAQEIDWISVQAYGRSGLIGRAGSEGSIFAEGAAAILLAPEGPGSVIDYSHEGYSFTTLEKAKRLLQMMLDGLPIPDRILSSATGGILDVVEENVFASLFPDVPVETPKRVSGDSLAAASLQHVILADLALRAGSARRVLISSVGGSSQINALCLTQGDGS